ncbi:Rho-GAP domain-containing protein [Entamoeba marina]
MDSIKSKTERATNVMAAAIDKTECSETEFAYNKLKLVDAIESYSKKQRSITNKILDAFSTLTDCFGNLAELHRSRLADIPTHKKYNDKREDQTLSINFLLFMQGNFKVVRDELYKGYAKQTENIISEVTDTKSVLTRNLRKPVDSLETMTTMFYQLEKGIEKRNQVIQRRQYSAMYLMNQNVTTYFVNNGNLHNAMSETSDIESYCQRHSLKGVSYVGRLLGEILDDEKRERDELPRSIEHIISLLEDKYYENEGIFRTNASGAIVNELYHRLSVSTISEFPCEVLASVLKKFVRGLPGMMFCNSLAKDVMTEYMKSGAKEDRINNLSNLFYSPSWIPEEKLVLFQSIIKLCYKISLSSSINLMTEANLSVCWTPTMFSVSNDDLPDFLKMMQFIIAEYPAIFPKKHRAPQPSPRQKRTMVPKNDFLFSTEAQPQKITTTAPTLYDFTISPRSSNSPPQTLSSPTMESLSKDEQPPKTQQRDLASRYPMIPQRTVTVGQATSPQKQPIQKNLPPKPSSKAPPRHAPPSPPTRPSPSHESTNDHTHEPTHDSNGQVASLNDNPTETTENAFILDD